MKDTHNHSSQTRDDLTGEHRLGDAGQIILACIFAAVWITDTFIFKYTTFLNGHLSLTVRVPLGTIFFILAGYFSRTGLSVVFNEVRKEPGVIRKGVFGLVRHPIYLSEIMLYLGFLQMSLSLAAALVWLVAIAFLHYISRHEERLLLARFDTEYRQYMQEVPMWIPRLRRRRQA
jgi:protein-S-isoprenylcysteine O-methyltransferase Ste14